MRWLIPVFGVLGVVGHVLGAEPRASDVEDRRGPGTSIETEISRPPTVDGPGVCDARTIPFDGGEGKTIITIDIHDTIDLGLAPFVKRIVEEAEESGAALILLNMNTPGGRLDAAGDIKDALLESQVPTATFIDRHALSAGALIAYATDFIIVTDGSAMGAATPISIGGQGEAQPVGEKFVSAVRAMFRATAEAKDRRGDIAEAMVDMDVEVGGLIEAEKLLTLDHEQLVTWCVADARADDIPGVLAALNLTGATIVKRELNWAERIARVLTDPVISGLLMTFGFLGLMMELYSPGFGAAGFVGIACLSLFFLGHLVVNLVGVEEIVLLGLGIALLVTEVFITPGFGIIGALGVVALVAAVTLSMVGQDVSFSWDYGVLPDALLRVGLAFVGTVVLFAVAAKFLPDTPVFRRLVLEAAVEGTSFQATPDGPSRGDGGVAATRIRGSGKARFGGRSYDVVTLGDPIDKGAAVVILTARPGEIVVGPAGEEGAA